MFAGDLSLWRWTVMSHTTSVFCECNPGLDAIREWVEEQVGTALSPVQLEEACRYEASVQGIVIGLIDDHGLVDDQGIQFSNYRWELDFTRYAGPDVDARTERWRSLAFAAAERISDQYGCECLVVDNVQQVLQRFSGSGAS